MNPTDPIDIMARTIWGEARGEGHSGMVAVANVIMNRVAHPKWWGNDVISVCTKPYQFSCWLKSDPNREKLIAVTANDPQFADALQIAANAVHGGLDDITHSATSYYDSRMPDPPSWAEAMEPVAEIGHHLFFKDA